ncbi:MAG: hypothetical protein HY071_02860 [Chloroflexi bacterium]|nr:hypothetical protein [Chloroflexota bacterium]
MLIREDPATEVTVATRILAHAGALAPDGRVAALVGTEVVYLAARGISPHTMTPYDVAAVRLSDASVLAGEPPEDVARYLEALRRTGSRAAARAGDGTIVTASTVRACVAAMLRSSWEEAETAARSSGALVGAYPLGSQEY